MGGTAIKFENVSKQYRLGMIGTGTLSHDLKRWWTVSVRGKEDPYLKIGSGNNRKPGSNDEYVWALRDINLEVKQGEILGIIGKNGAGKSTLLKLLSRVTAPTTGLIKTKGRIASLLEVGTGFHPEMTGRENVFMNGSIMGMTKVEIRRKFDEIVSFAGVEKYIDTPVKRYSSGMTVRLGFAIAAHLEPEILVVDEVLAVGDAEFQKKAIGKMQDISKGGGRTVIFVSHNMGAIRTLCSQTALIENGLIIEMTSTEEAINKYLYIRTSGAFTYKATKLNEIGIINARLLNSLNESTNTYDFGDRIRCEVGMKIPECIGGLVITIGLQNIYKNRIFSSDHPLDKLKRKINGIISIILEFPRLPYSPGNYSIIMGLHVPNIVSYEILDEILPFEIIDKGSSQSKYNAFTGDMLEPCKLTEKE